MTNTKERSAHWTEFLASRPEFPAGNKLLAAFGEGRITNLCDCGCNSYEFELPAEPKSQQLAPAGAGGAVFELSFHAVDATAPEEPGSLEFIVFVDGRGHFSGIEVDFSGNSRPVPAHVRITEPPYQVWGSSGVDA